MVSEEAGCAISSAADGVAVVKHRLDGLVGDRRAGMTDSDVAITLQHASGELEHALARVMRAWAEVERGL